MKRLLTLIICLLAINSNSFAMNVPVTIGINGQGTSMKPVPVTIEKSSTFEFGDKLLIEAGDSEVTININEAILDGPNWPLETEIFIKNNQTSVIYSHYRQGLEIDQQELEILLNDELALGILTDLDQVIIESPDLTAYDLSGQALNESTLNMLDYLYLNSFYTETLSDDAVESILAWIAKGGTVFVQSDIGLHQTCTGFLQPLKNKNSMAYQFGKIQNTTDINKSLLEANSNRIYPSVSLNNYRGLNKTLLRLNEKSTWSIFVITAGIALIGLLIIWLPNIQNRLKYMGYVGLVLLSFGIMSFAYAKPLTSQTGIEWHNGMSTKTITCLHSLEKEDTSLALTMGDDYTELYKSKSEDEHSLITFYEHVDSGDMQNISTQLRLKNKHLNGQMTWLNPQPLDQAVLIIGDTLIPIGTIKENQTVNIDFQLDNSKLNITDYQRQIALVKNGQWHMDESLIFNEFQQWYQASQEFNNDQPLLIGFQNKTTETLEARIMLVESLSLEGGVLNE